MELSRANNSTSARFNANFIRTFLESLVGSLLCLAGYAMTKMFSLLVFGLHRVMYNFFNVRRCRWIHKSKQTQKMTGCILISLHVLASFQCVSGQMVNESRIDYFLDSLKFCSTGSSQVRVVAVNFGESNRCVAMTLGMSGTQGSRWISHSTVSSRVPAGWGQSLQVVLSSDMQVVRSNKVFSYGLAHGSSFPMNIPTSGSLVLSVVGSFFVVESSASAYTGFSRCLSTIWKSSSAMLCRATGGLGAGWPMHFSLQARATLALLSFDRIRLDSMIYSNTSVFVNGSGFGRDMATVMEHSQAPSTLLSAYTSVSVAFLSLESKQSAFQLDSLAASVLFDDVSRLDDVTVSLRPPSGVSVSSIPLLYSRCFGCLLNASSSISFVFSDDAVSEVPAFGCGSGVFKPQGSLKLKNLLSSRAAFGQWSLLIAAGSSDLRIRSASIDFVLSSLKGSIGLTPVSTLVWSSDSSISVLVSPGFGQALNLTATSAMQLSSNVLQYSYLHPVMNALHPAVLGSTAASRVLLFGSRYQIVDFSPRLRIGTACAASIWSSDSVIVCRLGFLRNADLSASVTLGLTTVSSETMATGVSAPAAFLASHKYAQLTGGGIIDIYGTAFGLHGISSRVSLARSSAVATIWLSDSQLVSKLELPRFRALLAASVFQFVANLTLDNISMTVALSSSARNIPATGSHVEFIYGTNIGAYSLSSSAMLGSTAVERLVWISSSSMSCKLPSGSRTWTPSGTGIFTSLSQLVGVASVRHASPVVSNFSISVNQTVALIFGAVGSGFGSNNPSPVVYLQSLLTQQTLWYSDSSMSIAMNADRISTDFLLLNFAISNTNHDLISSSQVLSPLFVPKPIPVVEVLNAKVYVPVPVVLLDRMVLFAAQGLAASGDLPSPDIYDVADVGLLEEVNVGAIIYNNGTQVFSKGYLSVSKPITGTFSIVDALNLRSVNISCGGLETSFVATLEANSFAVIVQAGLVFCPSLSMRVAITATFSIPGKRFANFFCIC